MKTSQRKDESRGLDDQERSSEHSLEAEQIVVAARSGSSGVLARIGLQIGISAKSLRDDLGRVLRWRRFESGSTGPSTARRSQSFRELPAYKSIQKNLQIAERFNFSDPFYRCRDDDAGPETLIAGRRYLNFASYDYLGLNGNPAVVRAAKTAIDRFGTSVSASRIVAGEIPLHGKLEQALARIYDADSALAFVSGHATNVSTISALMDVNDIVIYDELSHNSIVVGAKLSGSATFSFRHNDMDALERLLKRERPLRRNALIVVEGLYSMDGDLPDLPRLIDMKQRYGAWLMVDEAHALGVVGKRGFGSAEHFGLDPKLVDIWMGTLSKTLAGCGGYIAGAKELIDILKFRAAGQVYSVGLSPPLAAAALASLELLIAEPERVTQLRSNSALFLNEAKARGLNTVTSEGYAIVPVIVGDIVRAGRITDRMRARAVNVLPIIYPAVPLKAARLRFFVRSSHTPEQIRKAVEITASELALVSRF